MRIEQYQQYIWHIYPESDTDFIFISNVLNSIFFGLWMTTDKNGISTPLEMTPIKYYDSLYYELEAK